MLNSMLDGGKKTVNKSEAGKFDLGGLDRYPRNGAEGLKNGPKNENRNQGTREISKGALKSKSRKFNFRFNFGGGLTENSE